MRPIDRVDQSVQLYNPVLKIARVYMHVLNAGIFIVAAHLRRFPAQEYQHHMKNATLIVCRIVVCGALIHVKGKFVESVFHWRVTRQLYI